MICRPFSSDEKVAFEIFEKGVYRRVRDGFDVKRGERWLDLGANIGAFAEYCSCKGATAVCYEPDAECFKVLLQNLPEGCEAHNSAVSAFAAPRLDAMRSHNPNDHSRLTLLAVKKFVPAGSVSNVHIATLCDQTFDGIKMDIEGSEGPILDVGLLPTCDKFVMEYHSSRDPSVENFARRMSFLRTRFKRVCYPPEFDRIIASGQLRFEREVIEKGRPRTVQYPVHDRMIFCWGKL